MSLLFDSHIHSHNSHDSGQTLEQICVSAIEKGLAGVAVTDHADIWYLEEAHTFERIAASAAEAKAANARYGRQVRVFSGIELSEHPDDPESTRKLLELADYDVVLGSVHCIRFMEWDDAYSRISFDETVPAEKIEAFLGVYFQRVLSVARQEDYDVLSHLTCPLRYINGRYKRGIGAEPHRETIREILACVIERQKSLEVNTSGLGSYYGALLPDESILAQYYAMGGRRITLGSDGHVPERIGNGFYETIERLKQIGFTGYYYYKKRQPRFVPFD